MSSHEARINDALKQLGEEFRLGMVAVDEYRSRRRLLLESWGEIEVTTSPGSLRSLGVTGPAPAPASRVPSAPPPKKSQAMLLVAAGAALLVLGGAASVMSHRTQPAGSNSIRSAAPIAPASAEVQAVKKAADDFLSRNNWDAGSIDAFLTQWRALSAPDRERALEEPSLRTLRHELSQNRKAEAQLVAPDAPPEQRQRLDALTRFEQELGGS